MTALDELPIAEAGRRLRDGSLTSMALTQHSLDRIAALDGALHSFVLVTEARALADAARADAELAAGYDRGPMHGIPYTLKDIYDTASGVETDTVADSEGTFEPRSTLTRPGRIHEGHP